MWELWVSIVYTTRTPCYTLLLFVLFMISPALFVCSVKLWLMIVFGSNYPIQSVVSHRRIRTGIGFCFPIYELRSFLLACPSIMVGTSLIYSYFSLAWCFTIVWFGSLVLNNTYSYTLYSGCRLSFFALVLVVLLEDLPSACLKLLLLT